LNACSTAGKCRIAIGGNFDDSSFGSYTALLGFLKQEFEGKLAKVNFKPTVRSAEDAGVHVPKASLSGKGLSLVPVKADGSLGERNEGAGEPRAAPWIEPPLNHDCRRYGGAGGRRIEQGYRSGVHDHVVGRSDADDPVEYGNGESEDDGLRAARPRANFKETIPCSRRCA
jgi:hypothetical protein